MTSWLRGGCATPLALAACFSVLGAGRGGALFSSTGQKNRLSFYLEAACRRESGVLFAENSACNWWPLQWGKSPALLDWRCGRAKKISEKLSTKLRTRARPDRVSGVQFEASVDESRIDDSQQGETTPISTPSPLVSLRVRFSWCIPELKCASLARSLARCCLRDRNVAPASLLFTRGS